MIRITKNTKEQVTFEKDTWEETWFNNDCSDANLLKQCNREDDTIERVQFQDGKHIGSILYVYFKIKQKQNMEFTKTERGFSILKFKDRYGSECSLQKSSLATEDAIWFGVDDADPKILSNNGWLKFNIPEEVLLSTRMHLTQEQVIVLLPLLQKFAETGEL